MVRCSVVGCQSDSEKKIPDVSFHSFPCNGHIRQNWIQAIGRSDWTPKKFARICSRHFEQNVIIKKKKVSVLLPNAVPSLGIKTCFPTKSSSTTSHTEDNMKINSDSRTQVDFANSPNHSPSTMLKKLKRTLQKSTERLKKLRALREKSRRLTKKVANLENVIAALKVKSFVTEEDGELLKYIDPAAVKTVPRRGSSQSSDYAVPSSSNKGLRLDTATSSHPSNTVAKKRKFGEGNIPPLSSDAFVMRLTKCVCCLERDAEELLWAERPHVGSYGDLIKELFGVQFPVPDNVATKTRICDQCKAELERTLQFRTSMLAAQSRLKLAFWPTPSPDTEDIDMEQSIKEYEDDETAPEDINIEVTCKTEVDIEEHDVGAFSEATSSLVPRPAAKDAHTVQGTRKTTAERREVTSKPSAGSSRTKQPADNSNARINYSELHETGHLHVVMVGNRTVWQSPWVNEVYDVMASTSNEYVTMQGYGVPVSASGQSEKADSQASSSNDCSSPVVGNLATEEYTVTGSNRGSLSVKTTKVSEKSKRKPVKRPAKPSSEKFEERKEKRRLYMRNYRVQQSKKGKEARLQQMRQHKAEILISESDQAREARLQQMRQHKAEKRTSESDQAREARLQQMRQHKAEKLISESDQAREARLQQMRQHKAEKRSSESDQAREARLQKMRQHIAEKRTSESDQAREARLQQMRQHKAEKRASESDQAREARLQKMRQHKAQKRTS